MLSKNMREEGGRNLVLFSMYVYIHVALFLLFVFLLLSHSESV